jgi:hypothetical protein
MQYDGGRCEINPVTNQLENCEPYSTTNQTDLISKTNAEVHMRVSNALNFKAGVGYRYLSNSVAEPGFYLRTGTWAYIPLTVEYRFDVSPQVKMKLDLGYDYIFYGGIASNLSEASSAYKDLYMDQRGYGFNAGIQIRYANVYSATAYYESWVLNKSEQVETGGETFEEPENSSQSIGIRLGYDFY